MANPYQKEPSVGRLKTDWKLYVQDIQRRTWIGVILFVCAVVMFQSAVDELLNTLFVQPVLKHCATNILSDLVLIVFAIWSAIFCFRQYFKRLKITVGSLLIVVAVLSIYFKFFRFDGDYNFYRFSFYDKVAYFDLAIPAFLLLTASYRSYLKPMKQHQANHLTLIEDSPLPKIDDDVYEREAYAKHLAAHILATVPEDSFAINVTGDWGSGKTQFLQRLKKVIEKDPDTVVLDFNPWRAGKADAIIEDFFKTLSDKLKPYSKSVTQQVRDYSKKILLVGKEVQFRILDSIIGEWTGDTNMQKQYEQLNSAIRTIGKRIVILVDDVDRLTGKEVMEVLRLIRNTANFSNTFFVVGIDQRYVVNVLRHTKDFANEEEYLEKVFQLTITLPAFKKEVLVEALQKYLLYESMPPEQKLKTTDAVKKITKDFDDVTVPLFPAADHDNILEKLVDNVRHLKRFANSFKIAANILKDEVDIHDLMVLELIRNKSIVLYNKLRDRSLLGFNAAHGSEFTVNEEQWKKFLASEGRELTESEQDGLKRAVDYLVMDIAYKSSRKFQTADNFYLYFSYQLFDFISIKAFNETRIKEREEMTTQYKQWITEGKERELLAISTRLTDFKNTEELLKMIEVYSQTKGDHFRWLGLIGRLVFEYRRMNISKYFNNDNEVHITFLKRLMNDTNVEIFDRGQIANLFLTAYVDKTQSPESLILKQDEWNELLADLFGKYLEPLQELERRTLSFLTLNLKAKDSNQNTILYEPAAAKFKQTLLERPLLFAGYVKVILRNPLRVLINNEAEVAVYAFQGYIDQVFKDLQEFKTNLTVIDMDDDDYRLAKRIILKYIDNYIHNKQGFNISNKEERKAVRELISRYESYFEPIPLNSDNDEPQADLDGNSPTATA